MFREDSFESQETQLLADQISARLLDELSPIDVDWSVPAAVLSEPERLLRLAGLKAILPPDNAIHEKTSHDATLENYIRLSLDAVGDIETLDTFLSFVWQAMEDNPEEAQLLAQQVFWIWAPAAEIAGQYHHKVALEDQAFKVLLPEEHDQIIQSYTKDSLEAEGGLLGQVEQQIQELLELTLENPEAFSLQTRAKSVYSVWRKLRDENRSSAELFDLLGFRIIIDGEDEQAVQQCYVAMAAVASGFESEHTRLKDYIADPKPTGYQSLHLTLYTSFGFPFELQVRTSGMHHRAETDSELSHQAYDATFKEVPGKIKKVFRKVPKLYKWRDQATQYIHEHDGSTEGILGDDILFFRGDGNMYQIPRGATALDASFRVHSRRALRTKQITEQGKQIGFSTMIEHGAVLNIEYRDMYPTHRSHFDRMGQVVTTKSARKAIEKGWRKAAQDDLQLKGRLIISSMVGDLGLPDPLGVLDDVDRRMLADRIGVPNFNTLLEVVGAGNRSGKPSRVAQLIRSRLGIGDVAEIKPVRETTNTMSDEDILDSILIPAVDEQPECRVAGCCTERIRSGDPILVRPSKLEGIFKLHREDCVNIRDNSDTLQCLWQ